MYVNTLLSFIIQIGHTSLWVYNLTSACSKRFCRSDARSVFVPLRLRSRAGRQLAWCRLRPRAVAKTEPLPYIFLAPRDKLSCSRSAFVAARMSGFDERLRVAAAGATVLARDLAGPVEVQLGVR